MAFKDLESAEPLAEGIDLTLDRDPDLGEHPGRASSQIHSSLVGGATLGTAASLVAVSLHPLVSSLLTAHLFRVDLTTFRYSLTVDKPGGYVEATFSSCQKPIQRPIYLEALYFERHPYKPQRLPQLPTIAEW